MCLRMEGEPSQKGPVEGGMPPPPPPGMISDRAEGITTPRIPFQDNDYLIAFAVWKPPVFTSAQWKCKGKRKKKKQKKKTIYIMIAASGVGSAWDFTAPWATETICLPFPFQSLVEREGKTGGGQELFELNSHRAPEIGREIN